MKIVPTILVKNKTAYVKQIKKYEQFFDIAQIDVLNNTFIKSKSYYCSQTTKNLKTSLKFEMHLMIDKPLKFIKRWKTINSIKRFIVHIETIDEETFKLIKDELKGTKIDLALAINSSTNLQKIKKYYGKFRNLLIMAVKPGKNGAPFVKTTYDRIKTVKKYYPKLRVSVDGGVNHRTVIGLKQAGADQLNVGSYFIQAEDLKKAILNLKK